MTLTTDLHLVLFDCDGTLANTHGFLTRIVEQSFAHVGAELPAPDLMHQFYAMHFDEFFRACEGHLTMAQITQASDYMRTQLKAERAGGHLIEPFYPGVKELLHKLQERGYLLGIVTNKSGWGLESVLKTNGVEGMFVTLQHGDNNNPKPAPDMVYSALQATGADAANCLLIGDTVTDMHTARNAGVQAIGVIWAGHDSQPLREAGAMAIVDTPADLLPVIEAHFR